MKVQVEGVLGQQAESLERFQEVVESRGRNLEPQQVYFSKGHTRSQRYVESRQQLVSTHLRLTPHGTILIKASQDV